MKIRALVKKIIPIVDNLTATVKKRLQQIKQIQKLHQSGVSIREITKQLQINRHTVRKYLNGKPEILCRSNKRTSLDKYKSFIIECLQSGNTQMETVRKVSEQGCSCSTSNIRQYIYNVIKQYQIDVKKYVSSSSDIKFKKSNKKIEHITRKGIFQYLWMNGELTKEHHECLWNKYEVLTELESCILEFREIFELKKMPLLYLFIDRYKNSSIKELASFANGLSKDIDAIENAVASELSNGFVEGTNSKLKMIKRTMYGRCSRKLLEAKLMCNLNAS